MAMKKRLIAFGLLTLEGFVLQALINVLGLRKFLLLTVAVSFAIFLDWYFRQRFNTDIPGPRGLFALLFFVSIFLVVFRV